MATDDEEDRGRESFPAQDGSDDGGTRPASVRALVPTSRRAALVAAMVLALVTVTAFAVVGGAVALLTGGDEPEGGADPATTTNTAQTPEDAVDAFLAAAAEGDCDAVRDLMAEDVGGAVDSTTCEHDDDALADYAGLVRTGPAVLGPEAQASVVAEEEAPDDDAPYHRLAFFLQVADDGDRWSIEQVTIVDDAESGDDPTARAEVEQAVDAWTAAAAARECAAMTALAYPGFSEPPLQTEGCGQDDPLTRFPTDFTRTGQVVVVGDVGYVAGHASVGGEPTLEPQYYQLRRLDGAWRISDHQVSDWTLDEKVPEQVVAEFLAAFTARDCEALVSMVDQSIWADANLTHLGNECLFLDFPEPGDVDDPTPLDLTGATIVLPGIMVETSQGITVEGPAGRVRIQVASWSGMGWRVIDACAVDDWSRTSCAR